METIYFMLKVRMLDSELMEKLLHGCVAWTLGVKHFAVLHGAHRTLLLRVIDFHRRQGADHRMMSYAKTLKEAQCDSVERTTRKWRLLCAGAVQREKPE